MQPNALFEVVTVAKVIKHVSDGKLKLSRISQLRAIVYKSKYDPIFIGYYVIGNRELFALIFLIINPRASTFLWTFAWSCLEF